MLTLELDADSQEGSKCAWTRSTGYTWSGCSKTSHDLPLTAAHLVKAKDLSALPPAKVRFVEPMYALAVQKLPQGQEWLYEVKFDGYRCLAEKDSTGVTLWSRRRNLFTKQFPDIARAFERLPPNNPP
jgi:ATP-dependent DNA ligase